MGCRQIRVGDYAVFYLMRYLTVRYVCQISRLDNGDWSVRHDSKDVGQVSARAATRDEAIEKMKNEIRYRLELCPCTAESYQHIDVEIVEK